MASHGQCALCREFSVLCRSHIVPEFLHAPIYGEGHEMLVLREGAPRITTLRKGLREPLLCYSCEARIKKLEDYFNDAFCRNAAFAGQLPDGQLPCPSFNYALLKLFVLSVVWRASASKLPDFRQVRLGPHHERIRSMLLQGEPGDPSDYRIFAGLIYDPETRRRWDNVLLPPIRLRIQGLWAYRFVVAGASWTVMISRHGLPFGDGNHLTREGLLLTCCPYDRFVRLSGALNAVRSFPEDAKNLHS